VKYAVDRIRPEAASIGSWQYLSFWEELINDTLELATRTQGLSIEVHHQNLTRLRAMFAHLTWLIIVGVAVPLLALAFPLGRAARGGLAIVAVGGMIAVLASTLILLYRWITQLRLHHEGRLEV
jgi:Cu/Ag efflux pump CusA